MGGEERGAKARRIIDVFETRPNDQARNNSSTSEAGVSLAGKISRLVVSSERMPERSTAANSRFADAKVHRRVVGRIDGFLRSGNDEGERSEGAHFCRELYTRIAREISPRLQPLDSQRLNT